MSGENEVYNKLSSSNDETGSRINQKWTFYLIACVLTATSASFIFGYNIGVLNLPTNIILKFYSNRYFPEYNEGLAKLDAMRSFIDDYEAKHPDLIKTTSGQMMQTVSVAIESNNKEKRQAEEDEKIVTTTESPAIETTTSEKTDEEKYDEFKKALPDLESKINEFKVKVEKARTMLWTITNTVFVVGGTIGALTSKFFAETFGRRKGILLHYGFIFIGSLISYGGYFLNSPECIIISRLLFGVQGGMACGLIPTYLAEISPNSLRGATGVIHQLLLTLGILVSQLLGFRQIMGTDSLWPYLLALPILPALIGFVLLLVIFPETPSALINKFKDENGAREALKKLRAQNDVSFEVEELKNAKRDAGSETSISIGQLFTLPEYKWPLITGLTLQLTQQLCGINAIFFYSNQIFATAGIEESNIQYAIIMTGLINVISTIIVVPLIDRLGRKPLLVYPMALIIIDFIVLTVLLIFKESSQIIAYLSIVCIIIFIICFAVGLGPIPFLYVAECFRAEARSTALAVCMGTNWLANFLLTLSFPYMQQILGSYTFLVFTVIVAGALVVIVKKVPETKGRSVEEIMAKFDPRSAAKYTDTSAKLMANSNV